MKIDIIGRGNVGTHLARAFQNKGDVITVNSRTLEELRPDSDLYLICVSDDAIKQVARAMSKKLNPGGILAHTSGTTPLSALKGTHKNTGVFYPLQTFSKDVALNYKELPFFIEGDSKSTEKRLIDIARTVSDNVSRANSDKRRDLHIASVFCCNFTNHLWALAEEYLSRHGLDFKTMLPLITETARKAGRTSPAEAQTGPAVRNDKGILDRHFRRLEEENEPELQDLYSLLSLSIMSHHTKK